MPATRFARFAFSESRRRLASVRASVARLSSAATLLSCERTSPSFAEPPSWSVRKSDWILSPKLFRSQACQRRPRQALQASGEAGVTHLCSKQGCNPRPARLKRLACSLLLVVRISPQHGELASHSRHVAQLIPLAAQRGQLLLGRLNRAHNLPKLVSGSGSGHLRLLLLKLRLQTLQPGSLLRYGW